MYAIRSYYGKKTLCRLISTAISLLPLSEKFAIFTVGMNKKKTVAIYLFFDILAAFASWIIFSIYRYNVMDKPFRHPGFTTDSHFILPLLILPFFWVLIYYVTGYYNNIFRKSRLLELSQTFFNCLFGSIRNNFV